MEETAKRRRKKKRKHPEAATPGGAKPSRLRRKLTKPWRKLARLIPWPPTGTRNRGNQPSSAATSGTKRLPRAALLAPLLVAGIVLSVYLRSCNVTEVVVQDTEETIKVKQMMNEILQQEQQQPGAGAPGGVPGP